MTAQRRSGTRRLGSWGWVLVVAMATGTAAHAADPKPVTLAEVASDVSSPRLGNVVQLLRTEAESEIASIDWKNIGVTRRVVVSASLVKLESAETRGTSRSQATVFAALRDPKSGALLAMVQGRAQAEGSRDSTERDAAVGAVRGAMAAIPEAMRRMK